jgi:hypothetical protein
VLCVAVVVTVIGLSAITLSHVNTRTSQGAADEQKAALYAASAVEVVLAAIESQPDWRSVYVSGAESPETAFGEGTASWRLVDEKDGDLSDDEADPVRIHGIGRMGRATCVHSVEIRPRRLPLDALWTCLHAKGRFEIRSGRSLTARGAAASTNDELAVGDYGSLVGDAECLRKTGNGVVTGTLTEGAAPKALPGAAAFELYRDKAEQLPYNGNFDKDVLTPQVNSYGGQTGPDGLYFLDTHGNDLTIKGTRIHGTLVVDTRGRRVIVDEAVFLENYRADYPVLIVRGGLDLVYKSAVKPLSEYAWSANFNPPGAPYQGGTDSDQSDSYPNEVRGLVHATGNLRMDETARVFGVVLCEGAVVVEGDEELVHDPRIPANPPEGYGTEGSMRVDPMSCRREVLK